ncbi:MAG: nucleotidyltransferase family protein [Firmicutes bacterium]|nr:nucleotidyltransferase family protein [Bacillota bacterium]
MLKAYNKDIKTQLNVLLDIVTNNKLIHEICRISQELDLKNYYIGAGFIAQSAWNYMSNYSLTHGINDIDIAYFDEDVSLEKEDQVIKKAEELFEDYPLKVDLKNQARVHLWYKDHFGYEIKPYLSVEEAINTWPTTATSIGIRLNQDNSWQIYAPFGLNDLLSKIIRANRVQITKEIYEKKIERWIKYWSDLKIFPWEK